MRKIRVLDNVYDLITINMEDRFKDNVAFRFYDTANDAVTIMKVGDATAATESYVEDLGGGRRNLYIYRDFAKVTISISTM